MLLTDQGSRFQHLADYQDYLNEGVIAVTNVYRQYKNLSDQERLQQLETALRFLTSYQENLANYSALRSGVNRVSDENAPTSEALAAARADRPKRDGQHSVE